MILILYMIIYVQLLVELIENYTPEVSDFKVSYFTLLKFKLCCVHIKTVFDAAIQEGKIIAFNTLHTHNTYIQYINVLTNMN